MAEVTSKTEHIFAISKGEPAPIEIGMPPMASAMECLFLSDGYKYNMMTTMGEFFPIMRAAAIDILGLGGEKCTKKTT